MKGRKSPLLRKAGLRSVSKKQAGKKKLKDMLRHLLDLRDGVCQLKGAGMGKCGGHLQVCHILPKGKYRAQEFLPINVILGCWRHHENSSPDSWHSNPMVYAEWFRTTYPERWAVLSLIARKPSGSIPDAKLIELELMGEIQKLGGVW